MGTQQQDAHRRSLCLALCAAAVGLLVPNAALVAQEPVKPERIVVNDSGGAMGTSMRKAYFDAFEKMYGIRVVETSPVDFGKLRAMVESGNVEWTVTEIGGQDAIRAERLGLIERIDDNREGVGSNRAKEEPVQQFSAATELQGQVPSASAFTERGGKPLDEPQCTDRSIRSDLS